ncbi:hypothetical protein GWN42_27325 [candidate division KSB1 bacterium]|nr:hypothetical protein [Phycisphaerae bacterium]NIV96393.1 hypothetical protein [candidate division KSB1 bacterium]
MDPHVTINISITPEGLKVLEESPKEALAEFPIPPIPEGDTDGAEIELDENDFALPIHEEDFESAILEEEIPDLPEE